MGEKLNLNRNKTRNRSCIINTTWQHNFFSTSTLDQPWSTSQDNSQRQCEEGGQCQSKSVCRKHSGQSKKKKRRVFLWHFLWFNKTKTKWKNRYGSFLVQPLDTARKVWPSSKQRRVSGGVSGGWGIEGLEGGSHISQSARFGPNAVTAGDK